MTRKHSVSIASALRHSRPTIEDFTTTSADGANTFSNHISYDAALSQWIADTRAVADVLAADNPRFDRMRFALACGSQETIR